MASEAMKLGRRERQIMDAVYRFGRATAAEVLESLPDPPSYSAVRGMLRLLEDKGHLRHEQDGPRYVYIPTTARDDARRSALASIAVRARTYRPAIRRMRVTFPTTPFPASRAKRTRSAERSRARPSIRPAAARS